MIAIVDITLGILLGASLCLLGISAVSYWRSGSTPLLLVSIGLAIHASFTVFVLLAGHLTDMLSHVDGVQLVLLDAAIVVAALLLGVLGGRGVVRPS
jgi:hypothetical protein